MVHSNRMFCLSLAAARLGATACLLSVSTAASAGQIVCTSKISEVVVQPSGAVQINFVGVGTPALCNLNATISTSVAAVTPEVCRAWLSMFITAKATQQNFTMAIDYGTGNAPPATCANLPNFTNMLPAPFPYWFDLGG